MNRRGVALIAVLWVIALCTSLVGLGFGSVRHHVQAVTNRAVLVRARWAAEACVAVWQGRWAVRDRLPDTVDLGASVMCHVSAVDPTSRINVNTAGNDLLRRAVLAVGLPPGEVRLFLGSVAAALARGPIEYPEQLSALPGYDRRLTEVLTTVGPGAVNLNSAPAPVLAVLPGFTGEAVERILARRTAGRPLASLGDLARDLSPAGVAALREATHDLVGMLAFAASQRVVTAEGWVAARGLYPRVSITVLMATLPERAAIIRKRVW